MPSSQLWAVDVYGRVYSLSTAGQQWEQCHDAQMEFKRVTAAQQCCWGIACDHSIYLNVLASDLPIRYQEEAYENQRWNPVDGFTERLLPSDRWQWSDITGLQHRPLDSFQLSSTSWEWECDWFVDENFEGHPTEKGGWSYAIDFPATYTKDKKWNSCVRRRRWLRYRRYKAMDSWAKIPSHKTTLPDPFSDISCGGWEINDEPRGRLSLWAVSLQGKVWFREAICHNNPEGTVWEEVPLPGEVVQISCGPGDLVWGVLWEGQLIVREGIGRDCSKGTTWAEVESPSPDVGAIHVAVGVGVVWAITKDNKVWFRRGVNSHNPCGSGWISMVGEMITMNVGLNDQVWAIGSEDRSLYFRQGVTLSELSGKAWKAITVPRDRDRSHSSASAASVQSAGCYFTGEVQAPSMLSDVESDVEKDSTEGAGCLVLIQNPESNADTPIDQSCDPPTEVPQPRVPKVTSDSFISDLVSDREDVKSTSPVVLEEETLIKEEEDNVIPEREHGSSEGHCHRWSNVDLEEAMSEQAPTGHVQDSSDSCSLSSIATYTLVTDDLYRGDEHPLWAWVSGGGCSVDSHSHLHWFNTLTQSVQSMSLSVSPAQTTVWKRQIFDQLTERNKREMENFTHYEQAIEQSVWVKKGTMQWWRDWKPHKWVDVHFALEQFSGPEGNKDGILFVYYNYYEEKKYLHAFINEVTILVPVLNESKHTFAIYTPERTKQRWPIRVAAATEQEMHDWLALLSVSCCDSRKIHSPPSKQAIWSITCKGDIFVSEPTPSLEAVPYPTPCDQMFWRQVGGHLRIVECNSMGIVWGIGYDHTAWIYTGGYGGGFFQGLASSTDNIYTQTDIKSVYIYENQRWNPVTGYTNRGLPTDRYMWSDASGLHERTKTNTKPPSPQWTWVSDWTVDYSASGGTDKEGWQYAADFPASYHSCKTMKDFVRRRRWARKCKLATTGPWQEIPPISLSDVSILPCVEQTSVDVVPVWAISNKGDVLCRLGVTTLTPAGSSWLHVGTDQPFKSISIGSACQLWAIAKDGSAFYRGSVSKQSPAGQWCQLNSSSPHAYMSGPVSVGPLDQVVCSIYFHSLSCGTVCHRLGVQPLEPKGQSWDYGIGGGWDHITVRGNSTEPAQVHLPSVAQRSSFSTNAKVNRSVIFLHF
uniref:Tectonin beta-propeller repeat-containing protein 1 n=1 Tax=Gouania willdenowi TaxID=441366 RepID=A0A8C5E3T3_GOUWI